MSPLSTILSHPPLLPHHQCSLHPYIWPDLDSSRPAYSLASLLILPPHPSFVSFSQLPPSTAHQYTATMHPFSHSQQPAFDSQVMFGDSQCTQNMSHPPASLWQQHSQQPQQQPPRWPGRYLKKRPSQGLGECYDNEADWQAHRRPHLLCLAALSSLNPRVDVTFEVDPATVPKKRVHQVRR